MELQSLEHENENLLLKIFILRHGMFRINLLSKMENKRRFKVNGNLKNSSNLPMM